MDKKKDEKKSIIERLMNKDFIKRLKVKTINDIHRFVDKNNEDLMKSQMKTSEEKANKMERNLNSEKMEINCEITENKKSWTKSKPIEEMDNNSMPKRKRSDNAENLFKDSLDVNLKCTIYDEVLVKLIDRVVVGIMAGQSETRVKLFEECEASMAKPQHSSPRVTVDSGVALPTHDLRQISRQLELNLDESSFDSCDSGVIDLDLESNSGNSSLNV